MQGLGDQREAADQDADHEFGRSHGALATIEIAATEDLTL
jgi:hypothetical protein